MGSGAGSAAHRRVPRGGPQHGDPPLVAGGRKAQEMPCHLLALCAARRQQPGCRGVQRLTLQRRDLLVDGAPHQRMHEVERAAGSQDVDSHERVGARRRRGLVHAGECRGLVERRGRTQHRDRSRDRERLRR